MGDLRNKWKKAKDESFNVFKKMSAEHAKKAILEHKPPPPYPVKFDKDLGPTLDKLEAANKAKKPDEIKKQSVKAHDIITDYKKRVEKAKPLMYNSGAVLYNALQALERDVTHKS
jgi:hypothetical protein